MTSSDTISDAVQFAANAMVDARCTFEAAYKMAVYHAIIDELGPEWTAKQYDAFDWSKYRSFFTMPSIKKMRKDGWISYRVEEFELPLEVRERTVKKQEIVTLEDGSVFIHEITCFSKPYAVGDRARTKNALKVVKVERPPLPDFKGKRYIYYFN